MEKSITKCICGRGEDNRFMIQCEKCDCWQHGECVNISEANVPDKYYCTNCVPTKTTKKEKILANVIAVTSSRKPKQAIVLDNYSNIASSLVNLKPPPLSKPPPLTPIRLKVRESFVKHLPESYCTELEQELWYKYKSDKSSYTRRAREIGFNLGDPNNPQLKEQVLANTLPVIQLANMTSEQLASREVSSWRQSIRSEALKDIIIDEKLNIPKLPSSKNSSLYVPSERIYSTQPLSDIDNGNDNMKIVGRIVSEKEKDNEKEKEAKTNDEKEKEAKTNDDNFDFEISNTIPNNNNVVSDLNPSIDMNSSFQSGSHDGVIFDDVEMDLNDDDGKSTSSLLSKKRSRSLKSPSHKKHKGEVNFEIPSPGDILWEGQVLRSRSEDTAGIFSVRAVYLTSNDLSSNVNSIWNFSLPKQIRSVGRIKYDILLNFLKDNITTRKKILLLLSLELISNENENPDFYKEFSTYFEEHQRAAVFDLQSSKGVMLYIMPSSILSDVNSPFNFKNIHDIYKATPPSFNNLWAIAMISPDLTSTYSKFISRHGPCSEELSKWLTDPRQMRSIPPMCKESPSIKTKSSDTNSNETSNLLAALDDLESALRPQIQPQLTIPTNVPPGLPANRITDTASYTALSGALSQLLKTSADKQIPNINPVSHHHQQQIVPQGVPQVITNTQQMVPQVPSHLINVSQAPLQQVQQIPVPLQQYQYYHNIQQIRGRGNRTRPMIHRGRGLDTSVQIRSVPNEPQRGYYRGPRVIGGGRWRSRSRSGRGRY